MLILTGTLRQSGAIKTADEKEYLKLWVETETPPEGDRPGELKIHEFMFGKSEVPKLPEKGAQISLVVRNYVRGREIAYKALQVLSGVLTPAEASKAVGAK
jgi:hypothetical protein